MNRDFADLLQSFDRCGVEDLVVGGYAVMAYGDPRFTKDLDVWVRPPPSVVGEPGRTLYNLE